MKYLSFYKDVLKCGNEDDVFNYFLKSLKPSILLWSYFVNWEKVYRNTRKIELVLNNLNYLIGKDNFDDEFKFLIKQNPSIAKAIPVLIVRDGGGSSKFKILIDYSKKRFIYDDYDFGIENPDDETIEKYLEFVKETGLKELIVSRRIKNLVDYMIGVEAGLDSNGRKNRSGDSMESIVGFFINDICIKNNFKYLKEANAEKIKKEFGYDVPFDKSSRRYDFVVNTGKELFIFETNFYGGAGSKLKATAGEYKTLYDILFGKYNFIWITDGLGWPSTAKPLRETFNHNDYIFNLDMLEKGILEHVLDYKKLLNKDNK